MIDTIGFNGYTRLDTVGRPHSDKLHLVQTFTRTDAGHIAYKVTIDDPVYYTTPWTNERIMTLSNGDLLEYSCEENNRVAVGRSHQVVDSPERDSATRHPGNA